MTAKGNGGFFEGADDGIGASLQDPVGLQKLDMAAWDDSDPPPLEWIIPDIVPRGQVGLALDISGNCRSRTVAISPWY